MPAFSRLAACLLVFILPFAGMQGCKRKQIEGDTSAEAKHLFESVCAKCHGRDGRGGIPTAEGAPVPRNFNDATFQSARTDEELRSAIVHGKGVMPPFGALFDSAQTTLLVNHVRSFNPKK